MDYSSLPIRHQAEIVVCGGGTAGAFAAIAAAEAGRDVLVVEQFGMLGGSATAGLVTPVMRPHIDGEPMGSYLTEKLNQRLKALGAVDESGRYFDMTVLKIVLEEMCVEAGVRLLYYTQVADAVVNNGKLEAVVVCNKEGLSLIKGQVFIDCTGDGDVCVRAGAEYNKGNPDTGKNQPMSLRYLVEGIDTRALGDFLKEMIEKTGRTDGALVNARGHAHYMHINPKRECTLNFIFEEAVAKGDLLEEDYLYWQAFTMAGRAGCFAFNAPEFFEHIDGTKPEDLTLAQLNGKKRILGHLKFYKKYFKGFENAHIAEIATQVGIRETREIVTDYVLTADDLWGKKKFADGICQSNYPIDVHGRVLNNQHLGQGADDGKPWYDIPYRSLVVKGLDNLMVAGRCMGADFAAEASVRVQHSARATGEAAGIGAAMAVEKGVAPRAINGADVRKVMVDKGAVYAE